MTIPEFTLVHVYFAIALVHAAIFIWSCRRVVANHPELPTYVHYISIPVLSLVWPLVLLWALILCFRDRTMLGTFTIWLAITLMVLGIFLAANNAARAEFCLKRVDHGIERKAGFRWQWRTVDGKQCWFYSNRLLPREDLIWSFDEAEFNSDIDRVIERKFYRIEDDGVLVERGEDD